MARPSIADFFARTARRASAATEALRRRPASPGATPGDTIIDSVVVSRDGPTVAVPRDEAQRRE
ncbi:MAG: hypothetical protein H7Y32_02490, partial [Chloroflexales bacterium]|nr:hypothetical protein [Chloroflexales bacterium]